MCVDIYHSSTTRPIFLLHLCPNLQHCNIEVDKDNQGLINQRPIICVFVCGTAQNTTLKLELVMVVDVIKGRESNFHFLFGKLLYLCGFLPQYFSVHIYTDRGQLGPPIPNVACTFKANFQMIFPN